MPSESGEGGLLCPRCGYDVRTQMALARARRDQSPVCPECGLPVRGTECDGSDHPLVSERCSAVWVPLAVAADVAVLCTPARRAKDWQAAAATSSSRASWILCMLLFWEAAGFFLLASLPVVSKVTEHAVGTSYAHCDTPFSFSAWRAAFSYLWDHDLLAAIAWFASGPVVTSLALGALIWLGTRTHPYAPTSSWIHIVRRLALAMSPAIALVTCAALFLLLIVCDEQRAEMFAIDMVGLFPYEWVLVSSVVVVLVRLTWAGMADRSTRGACRYAAYVCLALLAAWAWLAVGGILILGDYMGILDLPGRIANS